MKTKKSRMLIYLEFHKPQEPEEVEQRLRQLASNDLFFTFRNLMVGIDHKNLKVITPMTVAINEENKIR